MTVSPSPPLSHNNPQVTPRLAHPDVHVPDDPGAVRVGQNAIQTLEVRTEHVLYGKPSIGHAEVSTCLRCCLPPHVLLACAVSGTLGNCPLLL